tara:strand:- start:1449 stop:1658 length:210 start_codon:yes stop_codon:yes gene_type:complete
MIEEIILGLVLILVGIIFLKFHKRVHYSPAPEGHPDIKNTTINETFLFVGWAFIIFGAFEVLREIVNLF